MDTDSEQADRPAGSAATRSRTLEEAGLTRPGKLVTLLAAIAFAGFLLWSTLASQRVECTVTVAFGGEQGTAGASADSEEKLCVRP